MGLHGDDKGRDACLEALYGQAPERAADRELQALLAQLGAPSRRPRRRSGGLGPSSPKVSRWLGDIRKYFPGTVVQMLQRDAMERLNLTEMLLQPETLRACEPDVNLVATLLSLKNAMPEEVRETARQVVRGVVEDLRKRLRDPMRQSVLGSLNRADRNHRPRVSEINWPLTIRSNLRHYQPELGTIIPEKVIGYGRRRQGLRHIVLCIDQSASMADSVVYGSIFGSVMASLPALSVTMVVFDTEVVDLSENLQDPVDLLFGATLGGGTDISRALAYCRKCITRPHDTLLLLISDLEDGGDQRRTVACCRDLLQRGVNLVPLLALDDAGAPAFNHALAHTLAALGAPVFAATPAVLPGLMAAAIERRDLGQWASAQGIATVPPRQLLD